MTASREFHDQHRPDEDEIVIECDLPAPAEKLWRALTVPALLAQWLLSDDMSAHLTPGTGRDGDAPSRGAPQDDPDLTLLDAEPPRTLRYRWSTHESRGGRERRMDSVLSFELTPIEGGGTHLRVVHGDFRAATVIRMTARRTPAASRGRRGPPVAMRALARAA